MTMGTALPRIERPQLKKRFDELPRSTLVSPGLECQSHPLQRQVEDQAGSQPGLLAKKSSNSCTGPWTGGTDLTSQAAQIVQS
jgi:hypothetical protein